jgi:ERCC4-related helicase
MFSLSEVVARNQDDRVLFQVTFYMRKLAQSLDLLRVFGPQKLLEFIRSDLTFANTNDSLSHIKEEVLAMIPAFNQKMSQMEVLSSLEADSTRAATLVEKLKEHKGESSRIIVFVERRNTAERLCRKLQSEPEVSSMNPEYLVGNSSANPIPKERQQEIMQKFRDGECQLIIATSVLEQGIDVAACNVVICFDGVKSLKSIIQSRGRARKQSATFIVFVSTGGRDRMNLLTLMERDMNYAIQELMHEKNSRIDADLEEEIDNFLDENSREVLNSDENEIDEIDEEEEDMEEFDDGDVIDLRFFNFGDPEALSEHVSSFFTSPKDRLKVTRRYIVAKFNAKDTVQERSKIIRVSFPSAFEVFSY